VFFADPTRSTAVENANRSSTDTQPSIVITIEHDSAFNNINSLATIASAASSTSRQCICTAANNNGTAATTAKTVEHSQAV
jgi:hypothetical protein